MTGCVTRVGSVVEGTSRNHPIIHTKNLFSRSNYMRHHTALVLKIHKVRRDFDPGGWSS